MVSYKNLLDAEIPRRDQEFCIHYELAERSRAIGFGGIGAIHTMVSRLQLEEAINRDLSLLKVHVPYFESDHVLNIAYNVMTGGTCLEDIDRLRDDTSYTTSLAAERIPDPTTAGDFLRRFEAADIEALQETLNQAAAKSGLYNLTRFEPKPLLTSMALTRPPRENASRAWTSTTKASGAMRR